MSASSQKVSHAELQMEKLRLDLVERLCSAFSQKGLPHHDVIARRLGQGSNHIYNIMNRRWDNVGFLAAFRTAHRLGMDVDMDTVVQYKGQRLTAGKAIRMGDYSTTGKALQGLRQETVPAMRDLMDMTGVTAQMIAKECDMAPQTASLLISPAKNSTSLVSLLQTMEKYGCEVSLVYRIIGDLKPGLQDLKLGSGRFSKDLDSGRAHTPGSSPISMRKAETKVEVQEIHDKLVAMFAKRYRDSTASLQQAAAICDVSEATMAKLTDPDRSSPRLETTLRACKVSGIGVMFKLRVEMEGTSLLKGKTLSSLEYADAAMPLALLLKGTNAVLKKVLEESGESMAETAERLGIPKYVIYECANANSVGVASLGNTISLLKVLGCSVKLEAAEGYDASRDQFLSRSAVMSRQPPDDDPSARSDVSEPGPAFSM
jgi:hypothetical protein